MPSVLLIEDEAPLARMMAVFLLDAGFEVATCESAEHAIERVRAYKPDVIVFNTIMEDVRKHACISRLREHSGGSKILDVSVEKNRLVRGIVDGHIEGGSGDAPAGRGSAGDADGRMRLPFEATALIGAVRSLLDSAPEAPAASR
jgi:CheY-like chemotaxis protein